MPSTYSTSEYLNEAGSLKDILKIIANGISNNAAKRKQATGFNFRSIASATKDLTMSFPVLCSDTIHPETATMLAKAVERNNISMLQMLIASYHIRANNGIEAIKMIHTNMDSSLKAEDLIDAVVGSVDYAKGNLYEMSDISKISSCKRPPINYAQLLEQARREFLNTCNIRYPESSFSESSIVDYTVSSYYDNITVLKEANNQPNIPFQDKTEELQFQQYKANLDAAARAKRDNAELYRMFLDYKKMNNDISNRKDDIAYRDKRDKLQDEKDIFKARRELFLRQLLDTDVKKANELQPTLMVVPFYYNDDAGNERTQEFVAGVKGRLITCSSEEIIEQISRFNKQGVNINNYIKATTGELSLAKDFIGGIEQAKIDAKKDSKLTKTSPIWRMLQARSSRSGIKRFIRLKNSRNAAAAITTLVITAQEAEYVLENYRVDITNPIIAREFMENYNLLCLIIVDEQTEVAKFLYDGEKYFTDYSFNALDRENNSNDTRKLISLLNKTR